MAQKLGLMLLVVIVGYSHTQFYIAKDHTDYFLNQIPDSSEVVIKIEKIINKTDSTQKFLASVKPATSRNYCSGELMVHLTSRADFALYDEILIRDISIHEIPKAMNPHQFDLKGYYGYKNVFHRAFLDEDQMVRIIRAKKSLSGLAYEVSLYFKDIIYKAVDDPSISAVLTGILLGIDDEIDINTRAVYAATGAAHILSVSGMHVGMILLLLNFILKFLDKNKKTKILKFIIISVVLLGYAMICGMGSTIMRAVLMCILILIGKNFFKQTNTMNILWAAAMLLLLANPGVLFDIGFQLSFMAVMGILILYPYVSQWYISENKILRTIWQWTAVSIAAQITTLPIIMYYFHNVTFISLIGNLIAVPLSTIILYGTIILLCVHRFVLIKSVVVYLLKKSVLMMNIGLNMLIIPSITYIDDVTLSRFQYASIYCMIFCLILYFFYKNKNFFRMALVAAIMSVLYEVVEDYFIFQKSELICYSTNDGIAIDIKDKGILYMIRQSTNIDEINFKTKNNQIYYSNVKSRSLESDTLISSTIYLKNGVLFYKDKIICLQQYDEKADLNIFSYYKKGLEYPNTIFLKGKKHNNAYVCNKDGAFIFPL